MAARRGSPRPTPSGIAQPLIVQRGLPCPRVSEGFLARARELGGKAALALRVLTSPMVPDHVVTERMAACLQCEHLTIMRDTTDPVALEYYCQCCGCPQWSRAELRRKNSRAAHACPADPPRFGEHLPVSAPAGDDD